MEIALYPTEWWKGGKLTIEPTEELWTAIKNKQFIVDDAFGYDPDEEEYSEEDQVLFFLISAVEELASICAIQNPAVWVERELEVLEAYEEYLADLDDDHHKYSDEDYNAIRSYYLYIVNSTRDDINCFCV